MSEARDERTYYERLYRMEAHLSAHVHINRDTVLAVHSVHRDEDRVVLRIGGGRSDLSVFLDGAELQRLHDVVHEALAELGQSVPGSSTHEAYAAGWDAAVSFVQTSTSEPVPAVPPAAPIGVDF